MERYSRQEAFYGIGESGQQKLLKSRVTMIGLGTLTSITASLQCTEAMKILLGSEDVRETLLAYDIWTNEIDEMTVCRDPECPVCGGE